MLTVLSGRGAIVSYRVRDDPRWLVLLMGSCRVRAVFRLAGSRLGSCRFRNFLNKPCSCLSLLG